MLLQAKHAGRMRQYGGLKKYGYVVGDTGCPDDEFIIAPQFDDADDFFIENLGCVKLNGKYGYINANGIFVIPPQFDDGHFFWQGRAIVALEGRYGYIDRTGTFLIAPQFENAGMFWARLARAKLGGLWGYIDPQGTWIIPPQFDFAWNFGRAVFETQTVWQAYVRIDRHYIRIGLNGEVIAQPSISSQDQACLMAQEAWHESAMD